MSLGKQQYAEFGKKKTPLPPLYLSCKKRRLAKYLTVGWYFLALSGGSRIFPSFPNRYTVLGVLLQSRRGINVALALKTS
jgi:hypothetical protein